MAGGTRRGLQSQPVRRLIRYYRPWAGRLLLATLMMALAACVPAAVVVLVEQILDRVLVNRDATGLAVLPIAIVGLYL